MSTISNIFVIVFALYLLENSDSLPPSMDYLQSGSIRGEFGRHIQTLETTGQEKQQLCGNRFVFMARLVCKSNFFIMQKKWSSNFGFNRFRREITLRKECCEVGCSPKTLLKLCNLGNPQPLTTTPAPLINSTKTGVPFAILKPLLEFFAITRKLSSNGYESNFPVLIPTASRTEISSFENTADEQSSIAIDIQTDERPNQAQQERSFVPKQNIIRDEDDEDLVFFAR